MGRLEVFVVALVVWLISVSDVFGAACDDYPQMWRFTCANGQQLDYRLDNHDEKQVWRDFLVGAIEPSEFVAALGVINAHLLVHPRQRLQFNVDMSVFAMNCERPGTMRRLGVI